MIEMKDCDDFCKKPVVIYMTIASMQQAVEYWFENQIFQNEVKIEEVSFSEKDHFRIEINRNK